MSVLGSEPLTQVRENDSISITAVALTLQKVNQRAMHMNIITCMCCKLLYSLNRNSYHIIIFICAVFWLTFCKVNSNSWPRSQALPAWERKIERKGESLVKFIM